MWWVGPMWPNCAFGDPKNLIWKKATSFGNLPHHGTKIADFFKISIFFFVLGVLGPETVFWGVLDQV